MLLVVPAVNRVDDANAWRTTQRGRCPRRSPELLELVGSPETYRLLVVDRGWSGSRFEQWYADTLVRLLLDPD